MPGYKGNTVSKAMKVRAAVDEKLRQHERDGAAIRREIAAIKKTIAKLAKILKK